MPVQPAAIAARRRLEAYLRKKAMTHTALSREVGVDQATVQRFLTGRTKTITPAVRKMLAYASIKEKDCINASVGSALDNPHIRQALERVWDGSDGSAKLLARLIVTVAPLVALRAPSTTT